MSTLLVKFIIDLRRHDLPSFAQRNGPLFHRWLPDGEKDAMVLDTGTSNAELKVWFERRGYVSGSFIRFDFKRQEVDPKIISKQAILEAGPLFGLVKIRGLSDEELETLCENKLGNKIYIMLGKKLIKYFIFPVVAKFLNILRINYGQYWLSELEKWDSRDDSLGLYCESTLHLKWSLDEGKTWKPFLPDKPVGTIRLTSIIHRTFPGYLTEEDWQKLGKQIRNYSELSLAELILSRTHQLLDRGDLKYALIEGVSALEIAINQFFRQKLHNNKILQKYVSQFIALPLCTQVLTVATVLGKNSLQDIECTIKAIDMRNKVVHDGANPPNSVKVELQGLLNTVSSLLPDPAFRFPSANPGNSIRPVEEWEKLEKNQTKGKRAV